MLPKELCKIFADQYANRYGYAASSFAGKGLLNDI